MWRWIAGAAIVLLCSTDCRAETPVRIDGFNAHDTREVVRALKEANEEGGNFVPIEAGYVRISISAVHGWSPKGHLASTTSIQAADLHVVVVWIDEVGNRDLCGIVKHEIVA